MLRVNNRDFPYEQGMTIADILAKKRYMDHMIVVKINNNFVRKEDYADREVNDGDDVKVIQEMVDQRYIELEKRFES